MRSEEKMKRKVVRLLQFLFPLSSFLFVLACASTPGPEDYYAGRRDGFARLAPGADLYIKANVKESRTILEKISFGTMTGAEFSDFLDMSDSLTAAVYGEGSARRFMAAASGKYPSARGGLFFSASKDWERARSVSGIEYWRSPKSGLSVFLSAGRAYVSDADPFAPPPGAESPPVLAVLEKGSVFSGWMERPKLSLNRIAAALGVPIEIPAERLLFGVYTADGGYRVVLRIETGNALQAGALVRIFSLTRTAISGAELPEKKGLEQLAAVFFANDPVQDGSAMVLTTGIMDGGDIALLFNTLTVY
jgi:hypothetical protein